MTLYVDSSALLRRYVHGPGHDLVVAEMAATPDWATSLVTHTEARVALRLISATATQHERLRAAFQRDWEAFWVVPLDNRCLGRAAELAAAGALRLVDAFHLAAADRLPRPLRYLTLDPHQVSAAVALGFEVVTPQPGPQPGD